MDGRETSIYTRAEEFLQVHRHSTLDGNSGDWNGLDRVWMTAKTKRSTQKAPWPIKLLI